MSASYMGLNATLRHNYEFKFGASMPSATKQYMHIVYIEYNTISK